jgi:hypothetical protein
VSVGPDPGSATSVICNGLFREFPASTALGFESPRRRQLNQCVRLKYDSPDCKRTAKLASKRDLEAQNRRPPGCRRRQSVLGCGGVATWRAWLRSAAGSSRPCPWRQGPPLLELLRRWMAGPVPALGQPGTRLRPLPRRRGRPPARRRAEPVPWTPTSIKFKFLDSSEIELGSARVRDPHHLCRRIGLGTLHPHRIPAARVRPHHAGRRGVRPKAYAKARRGQR